MTAHADVPTLLTADEAAQVLRVKTSWLERQAASRKVPFTMLGGCYRFTPEHLRRIVEIHETNPSDPAQDAPVRHETRPRKRAAGEPRSAVTPLRARPRQVPDRWQTAA